MSEKVWFLFDASNELANVDNIQEFKFDTLAEMNAFLEGVSVGVGWLNSTQFDSYEAAVTHCESVAIQARLHESDAPDD